MLNLDLLESINTLTMARRRHESLDQEMLDSVHNAPADAIAELRQNGCVDGLNTNDHPLMLTERGVRELEYLRRENGPKNSEGLPLAGTSSPSLAGQPTEATVATPRPEPRTREQLEAGDTTGLVGDEGQRNAQLEADRIRQEELDRQAAADQERDAAGREEFERKEREGAEQEQRNLAANLPAGEQK